MFFLKRLFFLVPLLLVISFLAFALDASWALSQGPGVFAPRRRTSVTM